MHFQRFWGRNFQKVFWASMPPDRPRTHSCKDSMLGQNDTASVNVFSWPYGPAESVLYSIQARRHGGGGGGAPGTKKVCLQDGKRFKMIQNVVMVGLTILMHLQQFEELKFLIFFLKPLQSVQPSRFRQDSSDFT